MNGEDYLHLCETLFSSPLYAIGAKNVRGRKGESLFPGDSLAIEWNNSGKEKEPSRQIYFLSIGPVLSRKNDGIFFANVEMEGKGQ